MASPSRRMHRAELADVRRQQLLKVAISLFGMKGYHATTMRDIARAARVSVGMIYQYFDDKEHLLSSVIMEILDSYLREIPRAVDGERDVRKRFHAAIMAYARVIDRNRDAAALGYRTSWALPKDRLAIIFRKEQETTDLIRRCVDDCIQARVFRPVDPEILTYQIAVLVHAWALSAWRLRRSLSVEEYVESNLKVLLAPVLNSEPGETGQIESGKAATKSS